MTKKRISFFVEHEVLEQFKELAKREGVPVSFLIRRAMRAWVAKRSEKHD